jgi:hypothetical protein
VCVLTSSTVDVAGPVIMLTVKMLKILLIAFMN